jgi:hypothetical protein
VAGIGDGEDAEIIERARAGQELFWGGAACWWGRMRGLLTPDRSRFSQPVDCPVEGLLPAAFAQTDSHNVVGHYLGPLRGGLESPEVLQKIPYMEMKLRLPEHLLMRVDKLTMAHSVEARVPFLDMSPTSTTTSSIGRSRVSVPRWSSGSRILRSAHGWRRCGSGLDCASSGLSTTPTFPGCCAAR